MNVYEKIKSLYSLHCLPCLILVSLAWTMILNLQIPVDFWLLASGSEKGVVGKWQRNRSDDYATKSLLRMVMFDTRTRMFGWHSNISCDGFKSVTHTRPDDIQTFNVEVSKDVRELGMCILLLGSTLDVRRGINVNHEITN